jgi:tetratricopeptide (TPR) repeat protein
MDAGEQAAFHGPPGDGVLPLEVALTRAANGARRARLTWLLGVCLGASGRYGEAFALLDRAVAVVGRAPSGEQDSVITEEGEASYLSLILSTLGSLHRQLARYEVARGHDERALALAGTPDARVDARLGLAADAVGENRPALASEHLAAARVELAGPIGPRDAAGWRVRTRAAWVEAEVALLTGAPEAARAPAAHAVRLATDAWAPRHQAKSRLFVAVAELGHDRVRARESLDQAWSSAVDLGCLPLVWPAGKLLLEAFGAELSDGQRMEVAKSAHDAVAVIRAGLPEAVGTPWAESTGLPTPSDVL